MAKKCSKGLIKVKVSVRDLEKNKITTKKHRTQFNSREDKTKRNDWFQDQKLLLHKNGKGNIKIFYDNLEQYNFIINKLKN